MKTLIIATAVVGAAGTAAADDVVLKTHDIPLALANQAAQAAVLACNDKGWRVSAAVVDRGGTLKALQRADRAGPHTVDASRRKAYTALSTRTATGDLVAAVQKDPDAAHLADIDGFLILAGGLPIRAGGEVIGAIGVGGAPGGQLDAQCAQAGIDKIAGQLK